MRQLQVEGAANRGFSEMIGILGQCEIRVPANRSRLQVTDLRPNCENESTSFPGGAFHPNFPAHYLY